MIIRKPFDFFTAAIILAGAVFMFHESLSIRQEMEIALGPAFFPRVLLGAIIIFSALLLQQSVRFGAREDKGTAPAAKPAASRGDVVLPWLFMVILGGYIALMPFAGYEASTFAFCFFSMTLLGERNPRSLALYVVVSALTTAALTYIFGHLLKLFLP